MGFLETTDSVAFYYILAIGLCVLISLLSTSKRARIYSAIFAFFWLVDFITPNPTPPAGEFVVSGASLWLYLYFSNGKPIINQPIEMWTVIVIITEVFIFVSHVIVFFGEVLLSMILVDVLFAFEIFVTTIAALPSAYKRVAPTLNPRK